MLKHLIAAVATLAICTAFGGCSGEVDSEEIETGEAEGAVCQNRTGIQNEPNPASIMNCGTANQFSPQSCIAYVGSFVRQQAALRCQHQGSATAPPNCTSECTSWLANANAYIDAHCKAIVYDYPVPAHHYVECPGNDDENHACKAQCQQYLILKSDGTQDAIDPPFNDCFYACDAQFPTH